MKRLLKAQLPVDFFFPVPGSLLNASIHVVHPSLALQENTSIGWS